MSSTSGTVIVYSEAYEKECCRSTKFEKRYKMIMELIQSYGLFEKLIVTPVGLDLDPLLLTAFHSSDYLEALVRLDELALREDYEVDEEMENFGLAYDCPAFPGVVSYATAAVAGTVTAAECLIKGECKTAINWAGGWHHAKRSEASGFCYLNDIVYGILKLRETYPRVLYIDFDLHHGDGVEEAFSSTPAVMTCSIHHWSRGFFPGTGKGDQIGFGKGRYSTINLPFDEGMDDACYISAFRRLCPVLLASFRPSALVVQCGADALASDPHRCFNLTLSAYLVCLSHLLAWDLPTLILGGGGYNFGDTAKLWAVLTSLAVANKDTLDTICSLSVADACQTEILLNKIGLSSDIPEHSFWRLYGPAFDISVTPSMRPNSNSDENVNRVVSRAIAHLESHAAQEKLSLVLEENSPTTELTTISSKFSPGSKDSIVS